MLFQPTSALAALPDIPSAKEGGINYQMSIWAGIFAPKGTPKEIIAKLATALDKALDDSPSRNGSPTWEERSLQTGKNTGQFRSPGKGGNCRWSPILKAASLTTH